jgi:hypothetical protein
VQHVIIHVSDLTKPRSDITMAAVVPLKFGTFEVTRQIFFRSKLSYALVNLKPIVPGRLYPDILAPDRDSQSM